MEENIKSKKTEKIRLGGDVLVARIIACVVILLGTMFIRFNNRYIYDSLKFWYQENIMEEKYSFKSVSENIKNICLPIKDQILSLFSNSADK